LATQPKANLLKVQKNISRPSVFWLLLALYTVWAVPVRSEDPPQQGPKTNNPPKLTDENHADDLGPDGKFDPAQLETLLAGRGNEVVQVFTKLLNFRDANKDGAAKNLFAQLDERIGKILLNRDADPAALTAEVMAALKKDGTLKPFEGGDSKDPEGDVKKEIETLFTLAKTSPLPITQAIVNTAKLAASTPQAPKQTVLTSLQKELPSPKVANNTGKNPGGNGPNGNGPGGNNGGGGSQDPKKELTPEEQEALAQKRREQEEEAELRRRAALLQEAQLRQAQGGGQGGGGSGGGGAGGGKGGGGRGAADGNLQSLLNEQKPQGLNETRQKLDPGSNREKQTPSLSELRNSLGQDNNNNKNDGKKSAEQASKLFDDVKKNDGPDINLNKKEPKTDPAEDPNAQFDPTAASGPVAKKDPVLSGPTTVPNVIGYYGGGGGASDPSFGSGGGGGFDSVVKGGAGAGGTGSAGTGGGGGDPFGSVGSDTYPEPDRPLKKVVVAFTGEGGDGGDGGGSTDGGNSNTPATRRKGGGLTAEIVYIGSEDEVRGRGVFAVSGNLRKWCKADGSPIGVCKRSKKMQAQGLVKKSLASQAGSNQAGIGK
jgi:hypothetical protein